jgi:hypothetical protein
MPTDILSNFDPSLWDNVELYWEGGLRVVMADRCDRGLRLVESCDRILPVGHLYHIVAQDAC